jgi:hypothetical protein
LEAAMEIDKKILHRKKNKKETPHNFFNKNLFRQPSLAEGLY